MTSSRPSGRQADQLRTEEAAAAIAASGYYSLAQAIELVTIARLEEKRDGLLGNEEAYLAVQKEIDARKELLALIGAKEARGVDALFEGCLELAGVAVGPEGFH